MKFLKVEKVVISAAIDYKKQCSQTKIGLPKVFCIACSFK